MLQSSKFDDKLAEKLTLKHAINYFISAATFNFIHLGK